MNRDNEKIDKILAELMETTMDEFDAENKMTNDSANSQELDKLWSIVASLEEYDDELGEPDREVMMAFINQLPIPPQPTSSRHAWRNIFWLVPAGVAAVVFLMTITLSQSQPSSSVDSLLSNLNAESQQEEMAIAEENQIYNNIASRESSLLTMGTTQTND